MPASLFGFLGAVAGRFRSLGLPAHPQQGGLEHPSAGIVRVDAEHAVENRESLLELAVPRSEGGEGEQGIGIVCVPREPLPDEGRRIGPILAGQGWTLRAPGAGLAPPAGTCFETALFTGPVRGRGSPMAAEAPTKSRAAADTVAMKNEDGADKPTTVRIGSALEGFCGTVIDSGLPEKRAGSFISRLRLLNVPPGRLRKGAFAGRAQD